MNSVRARFLMPLALATLAGCVAQPQSPQEFKTVIGNGSGRKESYSVRRSFESVVKSVQERAEPGFNTRSEGTL
ncbi:MAG TPA: hypothetical protein VKW04_24550, partial [Planctomycetota bacterium]|nr:hypothetical protein [Planctomycetota bacterium]